MIRNSNKHKAGIQAVLVSALFSGLVPVFGKYALHLGFSSKAIVAYRAAFAVIILLILLLLTKRKYFAIYPVGLAGCLLAGFINGIGSIFYYSALVRLDASLGHLLYSSYPIFVALWLLLDHQPLRLVTYLQLALSIPAIYLLIAKGSHPIDLLGALFMLISSCLYALHLIINQWVLYEVPAPTVTLYTLMAISMVVIPTYLLFDHSIPVVQYGSSIIKLWWPIIALALIIFISRLTLFSGVKHLGGMQTALLGLAELLVAVFLSQWWLGEHLTPTQWLGAGLLFINLLLIGIDKVVPEIRRGSSWFAWLHPSKLSW